jgi:polyhydroxyalkanoate synthase
VAVAAPALPRLGALAQGGRARRAQLARAFAWLRPNDLVWNYVVNNYLLGNDPPAFDILAWNADSTNLPAGLHGQFLDIFEQNHLCRPGLLSVLDTPVNLSAVTCDTFATGGGHRPT